MFIKLSFSVFRKARNSDFALIQSYKLYRRLLVITSVINECFQNDFAIWIMTSLMAWVVVASAIISDSKVREILTTQEFCMTVFILCEIYTFFVVGYTFPGHAHVLSKRVKLKWTKHLTTQQKFINIRGKSGDEVVYIMGSPSCRGGGAALDRRIIRSFHDVKIRFGSVNFYGRMTALVVTQFVVEKSLKLMLLSKRK